VFALVKVIVSAVLISVITEVAKIYPKFGGMIAALPLVSLLSLCWLYVQGETTPYLCKFLFGVLWGFPATAFLLLVTALCLKASFSLIVSIALGIGAWGMFLLMQNIISKHL
jgi:hypothetical protein